jgi:tetratricopeptide (TPR) repeat protein
MAFFGICQAQELSAKEAVAYYNEGVRAQKDGDFDAALKAYQKAAIITSYYDKFIMQNKAVIYAQNGDLDKAEQLFKQVLNMDPNYMPAKLNLGLIYDTKQDRCKSLEYWADLFQLEKHKPKTFVAEGEQKAKD